MRNIPILALWAVVCLAPPAFAQVTGIVTGDSAQVGFPTVVSTANGANIASQVGNSQTNEYGNYQISSALTPNDIIFANNATTEGNFAYVSTSTSIAVTLTNNGATAVAPQIQSAIAPGGFGFYVAAPGVNPTQSPQTGVIGNINETPQGTFQTFDDFDALGSGVVLAGASFSLVIASNGVPIESFSASLTLTTNPNPPSGMDPDPPPIVTLTLGGMASTLNGLGLVTPVVTPLGDASAVGYQWNTTDITADFPASQGLLDPGDSRTLTYDTTVTAFTSAASTIGACGGYESCPTLQAYSGFGDPIGAGKGGTPPAAAALSANRFGALDSGGISDVYFPRFEFSLPTFNAATGDLSLPLSTTELPALPLTPAPVPEPETWVLMLAGLGGVGLALRRRAGRRLA